MPVCLKMAEFMPTVSMIRRECTFQRAERIGTPEESAKFQETWADLHARGLEYAKSIKDKCLPLPEPKIKPEARLVVATRDRLEKLARQAEQVKTNPNTRAMLCWKWHPPRWPGPNRDAS